MSLNNSLKNTSIKREKKIAIPASKLYLHIYISGTPYLTDSCIGSILKLNPLSRLKRFIMSHPVGQDQPLMVPLTARTVTSLHKSCPDLQCIGDLKYWALTSMQRRKLSFDLGCTLSISKWYCEKRSLPYTYISK